MTVRLIAQFNTTHNYKYFYQPLMYSLYTALFLTGALLCLLSHKQSHLIVSASKEFDFTTFGGNLQRTNYNPYETVISKNTGLLNQTKMFVNKWKLALDGFSLAQPLYLKATNIKGVVHDAVFISTEKGAFYAIDAMTGTILWKRSLGYVRDTACKDLAGHNWGIGGTAVIDSTRRYIYVSSNGALYCLSVYDGSNLSGWPLLSQYDPMLYHNYGAMTLLNSMLYLTLASHCDNNKYYGQLISYNVTSRTRTKIFLPAPIVPSTAYGAGIWGAAGLSVLNNANGTFLYTATGNTIGAVKENDGYAEHVLKLTPDLVVKASYTPGVLTGDDDFGATPIVITPTNKCATTFIMTEVKFGDLIISDVNLANTQIINMASGLYTFLSSVAFDSSRNMFYVGLPRDSSNGLYKHGVIAFKILNNCTIVKAWNTILNTGANIHDNVWPAPFVSGGIVYIGTGFESTLYGLDADTGTLLWTAPQALGVLFTSPSVVDGNLLISDGGINYSGNGTLYAYTMVNYNSSIAQTSAPTSVPSSKPTAPTVKPSCRPSQKPSLKPTAIPSSFPTNPTSVPSAKPSVPTYLPSTKPSVPTSIPSAKPTTKPSVPTSIPSAKPTAKPSVPTFLPSAKPTAKPSVPTFLPSTKPSVPTSIPSAKPTTKPSAPTSIPSAKPIFTSPSSTPV